MATSDYGNCDCCGTPLTEEDMQADFDRRADLIAEALDGADPVTCETLLAMFAGRHVSLFPVEGRKFARRELLREIDKETKEWVIRGCDA